MANAGIVGESLGQQGGSQDKSARLCGTFFPLDSASVKEALQDEYGGDLVDDGAMFGKSPAGSVKMAMGFSRGQPLVPEVDGQPGFIAEDLGKGLGL